MKFIQLKSAINITDQQIESVQKVVNTKVLRCRYQNSISQYIGQLTELLKSLRDQLEGLLKNAPNVDITEYENPFIQVIFADLFLTFFLPDDEPFQDPEDEVDEENEKVISTESPLFCKMNAFKAS